MDTPKNTGSVGIGSFVKRQVKGSGKTYSETLTFEEIAAHAQEQYLKGNYKDGYRNGVILINVDVSKGKKSNMLWNTFKFDRGLIPCDGFYFWKKINKSEKIPYYFKYIKNKLIYCAGIREKYDKIINIQYYS